MKRIPSPLTGDSYNGDGRKECLSVSGAKPSSSSIKGEKGKGVPFYGGKARHRREGRREEDAREGFVHISLSWNLKLARQGTKGKGNERGVALLL